MQGAETQFDLRDYLRVLRSRRSMILLATAVVVAAALAASLVQRKIYEGKAQVLLQPRTTDSLFDPNTGQPNDPARAVDTEVQLLKSQPVRDAVRRKLGTAPPVSAGSVGQTNVISVGARSASPKQAAAIANAYANAYVEFKTQGAVNDLLSAANQIQQKVDDLQRQIDALSTQIASASAASRASVEQNLGPRRDALVNQQSLFKAKLDQVQVDAALKDGGAQVVTRASTPTSPVSPNPKRNAIIALGVGLLLGIGLAFLLERLDDSIKTKDDLERAADGLPTLGVIPAVPSLREKAQAVSIVEPTSSAAEAYRGLRTAIQFTGLDRPMRTVQVTSPSAAEGKTTTLANLGVALARAGQRVVLVDCDLRRPHIHDFFGLPNDVGFTSVLLGEVPLAEAVQEVPDERLMMLLASGLLPPNPSELLSSRRTAQVLSALQAEADIVLIDSPPILPVTDAAVLSSRVDATLLVTNARTTSRGALTRAIELMRQVDAPVVGTVFNAVAEEDAYGYTYNYRYYESRDEASKRRTFAPDRG